MQGAANARPADSERKATHLPTLTLPHRSALVDLGWSPPEFGVDRRRGQGELQLMTPVLVMYTHHLFLLNMESYY